MPKQTGAESKEEFFQMIQQPLENRTFSSKQGSTKPDSSSSSSFKPIIDLGDDNEDECFDISSPTKIFKPPA